MTAPIVFLGDSITQQWDHYLPDTFADGWLINRGVGGETTRMMAQRLRAAMEDTGAQGLHLMGGLNDVAQNEGPVTADAIQANLAAMVAAAREHGARVWLGSLTPADRFPWNRAVTPRPTIAVINAWLAASADALGATFIDYHSVLATTAGGLQDRYGTDGVHLSRQGYEAIEPLMRAHLSPGEARTIPSVSRPLARFWSRIGR